VSPLGLWAGAGLVGTRLALWARTWLAVEWWLPGRFSPRAVGPLPA
jgi:hypothetical protein